MRRRFRILSTRAVTPVASKHPHRGVREIAEQAFAQIQTGVRASRALVHNSGVSSFSITSYGDRLEAVGAGVSRAELVLIQCNDKIAGVVILSTCTQTYCIVCGSSSGETFGDVSARPVRNLVMASMSGRPLMDIKPKDGRDRYNDCGEGSKYKHIGIRAQKEGG